MPGETPEVMGGTEHHQREKIREKLRTGREQVHAWVDGQLENHDGVETVVRGVRDWAERNLRDVKLRDTFYALLWAQLSARSGGSKNPERMQELMSRIHALRNDPVEGTNTVQFLARRGYQEERRAAYREFSTTPEGRAAMVGRRRFIPEAPADPLLEDWQMLLDEAPRPRSGGSQEVLDRQRGAGAILAEMVNDLATGNWQALFREENTDPERIADRLRLLNTMITPLLNGRAPGIMGGRSADVRQWMENNGLSQETIARAREQLPSAIGAYQRASRTSRGEVAEVSRIRSATDRIIATGKFERWLRDNPDPTKNRLTSFQRYLASRPAPGPAAGAVVMAE